MSYSISTLLTCNLHDVFGENDPARRRAAIDEIFTEDCVFYEPRGVSCEERVMCRATCERLVWIGTFVLIASAGAGHVLFGQGLF